MGVAWMGVEAWEGEVCGSGKLTSTFAKTNIERMASVRMSSCRGLELIFFAISSKGPAQTS